LQASVSEKKLYISVHKADLYFKYIKVV